MSNLALDLRMAFRALVRGRFGSALAVLAFALGIGVTTAVFTIFNAVILRPLPSWRSHCSPRRFRHARPGGWTRSSSCATANCETAISSFDM
jgi:hypothetical protein